MTNIEIVTILALILNLGALIVVAIQTHLTGKALRSATISTTLSIKTMQVNMLPSAGWLIDITCKFNSWIKNLNDTINICRNIELTKDANHLEKLANDSSIYCTGLLHSQFRKHAPLWLINIGIAGAQYYYNAKSLQTCLWLPSKNTPNFELIPPFIQRCEDSIYWLNELLTFLDDVIPKAYLNAPASINEDRFFL
ncbi:MAG TPA: hypothetical protein PLF13_14425 [candidate division Zixibacteria bacterium]|nr:hypothetical protein [candidate division Zixibacteria bacterium]